MRFNDIVYPFLMEAARIQHAEDILFWEGGQGAQRVLNSFSSLADQGHQAVTIKWDGSPAIIFGRDQNGDFVLTDKSGFTAKGYDGKSKSPDELENMLLNRSGGKNRDNPSYRNFAANMKDIFDEYEKAVPDDYRGFFKGDLLYFNKPEIQDGHYVFTPNVVTYAVPVDSDLGRKVGQSKTGVVIHRQVDLTGEETPLEDTSNVFQGSEVLVVPPVTVQKPAKINSQAFDQLQSIVSQNAAKLDTLFDEQELSQRKMKDFPGILYNYSNSKVATGFQNIGKDFAQWVTNNDKISDRKKQNILEYIQAHAEGFSALWVIYNAIVSLKDDIIGQFDQDLNNVKQSIGGQAGGEGYVMAQPAGDIKFVPREFFTKANRLKQR
jgi:hypothetical protein